MAHRRNSTNGDKYLYKGVKRSLSIENDVEKEYIFENEEGKVIVDQGPKFGKRYVEAILYFLGLFISYCTRVNLSLTVVAMTDPTANENKDIPTFNWTNRNVILSSFFWGYVIPQVMAGWLMTRYGPKWFMIGSVGIGSLVGYLLPPAAVYMGSMGVIICRMIQGFCQGFMIPAVPIFLSRWVPLSERGRICNFIYAASCVGTVFGMMISGSLSASLYGWPMVFHFFSTLGIIWCIIYAICGCNSPAESKSITAEELAYIEMTAIQSKKRLKTPWKGIFTSVPFYALFYTYTCFILGFWILLSQIPTYLNKIMKFDLKSNGFLSALPYIVQFVLSLLFSVISDYVTNRKILTLTSARKVFNCIGMIIPAISLIFLGYCTNATLGVVVLIIGVGTNSAATCSAFINNVDLAPNFSGVVQGIVNGFSNICGILAPLIVQVLVTDEENQVHWRRTFYLASAVYISGAIIFCIFGSGEVQPWNDDKKDEDSEEA